MIVNRKECFAVVVDGSVPVTDLPKFEEKLTKLLLAQNAKLKTHYDEAVATTVNLEERVTEEG